MGVPASAKRLGSGTAVVLMVDQGRGPELLGVELPYIGRVDESAPIVIINASVGDGATIKCSKLLSQPQPND